MNNLTDLLRANPYPGRGIVAGSDRFIYFIMGRSENSRNRVFVPTADGIRTQAHDPARLQDPSLIIYHPVRQVGTDLVVTNGDQTDTIRDALLSGADFYRALMGRTYEPDAPHYTPRISSIRHADGSFALSILKRVAGRCLRAFYTYEGSEPGRGYFISTYAGDGDPLPAFAGEPRAVTVPEAAEVWAALDADNKVSMYVWDKGHVKLYNKNQGD